MVTRYKRKLQASYALPAALLEAIAVNHAYIECCTRNVTSRKQGSDN
jgi:hypothetical protein